MQSKNKYFLGGSNLETIFDPLNAYETLEAEHIDTHKVGQFQKTNLDRISVQT